MATVVDWSKKDWSALGGRAGGGKKSGPQEGKPEWLRIEKDAQVRPIGQAVEFVKIFVKTAKGSRSVIVDPEDAQKAVALISEKAGYEVRSTNRFAMNVIHRQDKRIKILEGGMQIFGFWGKWQNTTGIHPGSREGYDWMITSEKTGPDPENKKYIPIPMNQTAITPEEWEMINKKKTEYTLSEVYKSVPLDRVLDIVFGERSGPEDVAAPAATVTADPSPSTPAPKNAPIDW